MNASQQPRPASGADALPQASAGLLQSKGTSTREKVRLAVSEYGPVTAAQIGAQIGLTPAAMRRHLDALMAEGLIVERDVPPAGAKRRGRPARAYVLSEAGHDALPGGYDTLANQALRHLVRLGGQDAVQQLAHERAVEIARGVEPAVAEAGEDPQARAQALADALSGQGFAATARPVASGTPLAGVQLCQGHCPVQHVARDHPQFCEAEAEVFSEILGVHVQRLASLAQGDHVCTTFVPTPAVPGAAESAPNHSDNDLPDTAPKKKEQR